MTWLENPQKVLAFATVGVALGFTLIAAGVSLLQLSVG